MSTYKLLVRHEGTRRGRCSMRPAPIDAIAALTGMSDVFALKSMDVFALNIEVAPRPPAQPS
jgi:hypothetical protein